MDIKPIETVYKDYRFRSRLEARWAVFFDVLGIEYQYEPQGFVVGVMYEDCPGRPYLPDFYLPESKTWVEVKGEAQMLDWQLLAESVDWGCGLPGLTDSLGTRRGLLLLGPIPEIPRVSCRTWTGYRPNRKESSPGGWMPIHPILQHHKGGWVNHIVFRKSGLNLVGDEDYWFDSSWGEQSKQDWVHDVLRTFDGKLGLNNMPTDAVQAYVAARQARFEHGEVGNGR